MHRLSLEEILTMQVYPNNPVNISSITESMNNEEQRTNDTDSDLRTDTALPGGQH
jgi:hypothetical protein